jgi:hypothetical protein
VRDHLLETRDFDSVSAASLVSVGQNLPRCIHACVSNRQFPQAKGYHNLDQELQLALQEQAALLAECLAERSGRSTAPPPHEALDPAFASSAVVCDCGAFAN